MQTLAVLFIYRMPCHATHMHIHAKNLFVKMSKLRIAFRVNDTYVHPIPVLFPLENFQERSIKSIPPRSACSIDIPGYHFLSIAHKNITHRKHSKHDHRKIQAMLNAQRQHCTFMLDPTFRGRQEQTRSMLFWIHHRPLPSTQSDTSWTWRASTHECVTGVTSTSTSSRVTFSLILVTIGALIRLPRLDIRE